MGNSEGSIAGRESKHERNGLETKNSGSYKEVSKKRGIIRNSKGSLPHNTSYEYDKPLQVKQSSPGHSQETERSGILRNSKESSPNRKEEDDRQSTHINARDRGRNKEVENRTVLKHSLESPSRKSHAGSDDEEKEAKESHYKSESPKSPVRDQRHHQEEIELSDVGSHSSLSDDEDEDDSKQRRHNHLPSFIKPENKVLPTVVPVKPLHQTEFGAILQQGGSITRRKLQEQKDAEEARLKSLYQQNRLKHYPSNFSLHSQEFSDRGQFWPHSSPDIPPIDYDIPPPDYDNDDYDIELEGKLKKPTKKSKQSKNQRGNLVKDDRLFVSSPVINMQPQSDSIHYTWDSETEWYLPSKSGKKKKKDKENKGGKGKYFFNSLQRTESVKEGMSLKREKKKKIPKRSISLGPEESSLREKWKNREWLRVKKKEDSDGNESKIGKKKKTKRLNDIQSKNINDEREWRNPNNPYATGYEMHQYQEASPEFRKQYESQEDQRIEYNERYENKHSDGHHHSNEVWENSDNHKSLKRSDHMVSESRNVESNNLRRNESNIEPGRRNNRKGNKELSRKFQSDSHLDDYHRKVKQSNSGSSDNVERKLHMRHSPQKIDAGTSTSLDDMVPLPHQNKSKKKSSAIFEENSNRSKEIHGMKSPQSNVYMEDVYEKQISSDEEITQQKKHRRHHLQESNHDVIHSSEYRSKEYSSPPHLTNSTHNLYRGEGNSITKEVKHSFDHIITDLNHNDHSQPQQVLFGSMHGDLTNHPINENVSPAVKILKARNEHLQEEKVKELRDHSTNPWKQSIEMNLRPTVPKREFKMPPNFSPTQTWKVLKVENGDSGEDYRINGNDDILEEKIEKVIHPSVPSRGPKIINSVIQKDASSSDDSEDNDIDLYHGLNQEHYHSRNVSKKKIWTPEEDLIDDLESVDDYHKSTLIDHSPQTHLAMPTSMFSTSKPSNSKSPTPKKSGKQEKVDSSDSGSKFNSIRKIKESVRHAMGFKDRSPSGNHLDPNWSLVKNTSSEEERECRLSLNNRMTSSKSDEKNEHKEKYIFGESFGDRGRSKSAFRSYSPSGHLVYLPDYQRPASVDLFEKKRHKVARTFSFQSPEKIQEKQQLMAHISRQAEEREHQRELEKAHIQQVEEEFRRQREKQQLRENSILSRSEADVHKMSREGFNGFSHNSNHIPEWREKIYSREANPQFNNSRKYIYEKNIENKSEINMQRHRPYGNNFRNNDESNRKQWKSVDSIDSKLPLRAISPDNRVQSLWRERTRFRSPSPESGLKRSQSQRISQEEERRQWAKQRRSQSSERLIDHSHNQHNTGYDNGSYRDNELLFRHNLNSNELSNAKQQSQSRYLGQPYQSNSQIHSSSRGKKINRAQSELGPRKGAGQEKWREVSHKLIGGDRERSRSKTAYMNGDEYRVEERETSEERGQRDGAEIKSYTSKLKISVTKGGAFDDPPTNNRSRRVISSSASDLPSTNSRSAFSRRHHQNRVADV